MLELPPVSIMDIKGVSLAESRVYPWTQSNSASRAIDITPCSLCAAAHRLGHQLACTSAAAPDSGLTGSARQPALWQTSIHISPKSLRLGLVRIGIMADH